MRNQNLTNDEVQHLIDEQMRRIDSSSMEADAAMVHKKEKRFSMWSKIRSTIYKFLYY